jgi:hypothetical protein
MTKKQNLIVGMVLALNILIVWLPVQFQTAGIQEEWRIRALFDGNITTYGDSGNDTADEIFYTRPVIGILNQVAYLISPDSFVSHHLILIGLLLAKGVMLFLILRSLLPDFPLWGYLCALILIFYPSDPAVVSLRVIHTHLAIVMILSSIYYLIQYYQHIQRRSLILMWVSQIIAGFTIEIGYPIFFFTPLIILVLEKRISKRFIVSTILFYIVPAITFLYSIILILVVQVSWQRTALAPYTIRDYVKNIFNLYNYNFVTTWTNLFDTITTQATTNDLLVFGTTVFTTFIGGLLILRGKPKQAFNRKVMIKIGVVLLGGFIAVLLGYAMFLPSRTHVLTNYRVYLLSSIGLALVIGTLSYGMFLIASNTIIKYGILLVLSIIVGLSSVFANQTHHDYLEISEQQESIVQQLTEAVPALNKKATIVIKTQSNSIFKRINIGEMQKPVLFTPMLQYLYDDYDNIEAGVMCFTEYLSCEFTPDGLDIIATNYTGIESTIPYDQIILFNITKQGDLTIVDTDDALLNYDPAPLINSDTSPPYRLHTIYGSR